MATVHTFGPHDERGGRTVTADKPAPTPQEAADELVTKTVEATRKHSEQAPAMIAQLSQMTGYNMEAVITQAAEATEATRKAQGDLSRTSKEVDQPGWYERDAALEQARKTQQEMMAAITTDVRVAMEKTQHQQPAVAADHPAEHPAGQPVPARVPVAAAPAPAEHPAPEAHHVEYRADGKTPKVTEIHVTDGTTIPTQALQIALKAAGQNLGSFGAKGDGVDNDAGDMTQKALDNVRALAHIGTQGSKTITHEELELLGDPAKLIALKKQQAALDVAHAHDHPAVDGKHTAHNAPHTAAHPKTFAELLSPDIAKMDEKFVEATFKAVTDAKGAGTDPEKALKFLHDNGLAKDGHIGAAEVNFAYRQSHKDVKQDLAAIDDGHGHKAWVDPALLGKNSAAAIAQIEKMTGGEKADGVVIDAKDIESRVASLQHQMAEKGIHFRGNAHPDAAMMASALDDQAKREEKQGHNTAPKPLPTPAQIQVSMADMIGRD